jgi:hypothetical protein
MEDEHCNGLAWEDDCERDAQNENDDMEEDSADADHDTNDTNEADEVDENDDSSQFAFVAKVTEGHGEKLCKY